MADLYADALRLKLETGSELEAFVRIAPGEGHRPQCLLLHGNPGSLLDWQELIPRLSGTADLAAIDLPGFGKSRRESPKPESLTLERLAERAIFAADALGWHKPIHLIGHSHGGGVAQVAAARYPERVAGLVLIATLGAPAHATYRLLSLPGAAAFARLAGRLFRADRLRPLSRRILRRVMSNIFSPEPVPADQLEHELSVFAARPEILLSMVHVALGRPSATLWRCAPEIRCPTLFLHGRKDALVPERYARAIHERIVKAGGNSQFELLPAAGHMLINYQAAELADIILRSLRG